MGLQILRLAKARAYDFIKEEGLTIYLKSRLY